MIVEHLKEWQLVVVMERYTWWLKVCVIKFRSRSIILRIYSLLNSTRQKIHDKDAGNGQYVFMKSIPTHMGKIVLWLPASVTRKKSPKIYKSCPKMISLENERFLTPLQKLPKNVWDLGKLIVPKGFKKSPKVQ